MVFEISTETDIKIKTPIIRRSMISSAATSTSTTIHDNNVMILIYCFDFSVNTNYLFVNVIGRALLIANKRHVLKLTASSSQPYKTQVWNKLPINFILVSATIKIVRNCLNPCFQWL